MAGIDLTQITWVRPLHLIESDLHNKVAIPVNAKQTGCSALRGQPDRPEFHNRPGSQTIR